LHRIGVFHDARHRAVSRELLPHDFNLTTTAPQWKFQAPSTTFQINTKYQASNLKVLFLNIEIYILEFICDLEFVICGLIIPTAKQWFGGVFSVALSVASYMRS